MCNKLWQWFLGQGTLPVPDPPPEPTGKKKTALLFAINDYKGSGNDLNGCLNDQLNMEKMITTICPDIVVKKFADFQVTKNCFISEMKKAIAELKAGDLLLMHYSGHGTQLNDIHSDENDGYDEAIYLYDGVVIDDDIGFNLKNIPDGAVVVLFFDSCFSGTITRIMNSKKHPAKNRFIPYNDAPLRKKKRIRIPKEEMKHIVYSGCQENETSADAWFGKYEGAFTHYALKTMIQGMTYKQWIDAINKELPSVIYKQTPTLEGNELLFNNTIFE